MVAARTGRHVGYAWICGWMVVIALFVAPKPNELIFFVLVAEVLACSLLFFGTRAYGSTALVDRFVVGLVCH